MAAGGGCHMHKALLSNHNLPASWQVFYLAIPQNPF